MSFTVAEVLTEARELLLDTLEPYRYSDAFIIRRINQALRRMCVLRPDLFSTHETISCAAGILQTCPEGSMRLMDVVMNGDGRALKEIHQDTLDLMAPTWPAGATASPTDWMRYVRDPNRFYVFPRVEAGAQLSIVYAKSPVTVDLASTIPLPDAYMPTVIDGTCWLMESIDAEHVESGRAKSFKDSFEGALTAGLTVRRLTDTDAGGLPKDEVV